MLEPPGGGDPAPPERCPAVDERAQRVHWIKSVEHCNLPWLASNMQMPLVDHVWKALKAAVWMPSQ